VAAALRPTSGHPLAHSEPPRNRYDKVVELIRTFGYFANVPRGLEVGIYLQPELRDEAFVAQALGNLAAFKLQQLRKEKLEWQVLRVNGSAGQHHYRLVIRHPERVLDLGIHHDLSSTLNDLSHESEEELARRLSQAEAEGLQPVPLRTIHEAVDYWRDDFWHWMG
jgi:hypothetical protein